MSAPKTRGDSAPHEPESGARVTPVADALREALASFATQDRADAILAAALVRGAFDGLPRESTELSRLIDVEIAALVRVELGEDAAEAVVARLAPMILAISRMERAAREKPEPKRQSVRPATGRAFRIVLVVGADPRDTTELARTVAAPTSVIPVHEGRALASGLELLRDQPRLVLVDCRRATEPLEPLEGLEPALLEGALVLLWGATDAQRRGTIARFPGAEVSECRGVMTAKDIAALVHAGSTR